MKECLSKKLHLILEKLNIVKDYLVAADRTQHQFQGDLADACGAVNKMQAINECSMTKISR